MKDKNDLLVHTITANSRVCKCLLKKKTQTHKQVVSMGTKNFTPTTQPPIYIAFLKSSKREGGENTQCEKTGAALLW
jgi:hypothetical protein